MNKKIVIIIPTYSKYLDVCNILLILIKKYWPDCPFQIVISIIGESADTKYNENVKYVFNDKNDSLLKCIYNVSRLFDFDYCISLLGDSFITAEIDNNEIINIIRDIEKFGIEYCNLYPRAYYPCETKYLDENKRMRYINKLETYGFTFVGFICSNKYIENNFNTDKTDLDFELEYINKSHQCNKSEYYDNATVLIENDFNFMHGIEKGKWIRKTEKFLKKEGINTDSRRKLSIINTLKNSMITFLQYRLSPKQRKKIKIILKAFGFRFISDI